MVLHTNARLHDIVIFVCALYQVGKEQFRCQRYAVLELAAIPLCQCDPAAESEAGTVVLLEDRAQDLDIHRGAYSVILQRMMH